MKHRHRALIHSHILYTICLIGFVYALHLTLPMYVNSSFLGQFTSDPVVGLIYTLGSIATIAGFLFMSRWLEKIGNWRAAITLIVSQIIIFAGITWSNDFRIIAPLFILNLAVVSMIGFSLDIFLEKYTDVRHTGGIRGLYMTVINMAWVLAPLIGGSIIDGSSNYHMIYVVSFCILILLLYLIAKNFTHFEDPKYVHFSITGTLEELSRKKDLLKVFVANTIINTFYAWMVIYSPIYLNKQMGFTWDEIGLMFTIMLIPFVIMEIPLGKLADGRWGEKEIMSVGFVITGVTTYLLAFLGTSSLLVWTVALFATRIGASMTEIMIETYFFKKVNINEPNILSVFRITRPLATVIAPVITAVGLIYTSYSNLFIILGILVMSALFFTLTIRDTN